VKRATVWVFETLAWGLLAAIVALVVLQVVARYVLRVSLPWPEELARFLLVWLTFTGAVVGTWHHAHFRVDFLAERLPPRVRSGLGLALDVLTVGVLGLFVWQSLEVARLTGFMQSTAMEISMTWVYAALPLGGVLMLGWHVREVGRAIRRPGVSTSPSGSASGPA
jgi:TRAP-type transport system small permease protein